MKIEKLDLAFSGKLIPLKKVEKIICHHPAHPTWDINDIHKYHRDGKKWSGIGYNYFVTFDGRVQEARGRNQGAHTLGGWNEKSLGVSFQGDFSKQNMTDAQVASGAELIASLIRNEGLGINDVVGHKVLWNTACPGRNFRMSDLKAAILAELNPSVTKEVKQITKDKSVSTWAVDAQKWVKEQNISDGDRPKDIVTREQLWTMLYRYAGSPKV